MHESVQIDRTGFSGRGTEPQARVMVASMNMTRMTKSYARGAAKGGARRTITDPTE